DAYRSSDSCLFSTSLSRSVASSWADPACGASLRASSARECSRRASSRNASCLSSAALAGGEVLNLFFFRRLRGGRSGLGDARLFDVVRFYLERGLVVCL